MKDEGRMAEEGRWRTRSASDSRCNRFKTDVGITEMGKQPTNVQALREEGEEEGNPILSLLDEEGVFLQVELEPEREESPEHEAHTLDGLETEMR